MTLAPDQNELRIDFATVAFEPGEVPHHQYRLDPADADWSGPSLGNYLSGWCVPSNLLLC